MSRVHPALGQAQGEHEERRIRHALPERPQSLLPRATKLLDRGEAVRLDPRPERIVEPPVRLPDFLRDRLRAEGPFSPLLQERGRVNVRGPAREDVVVEAGQVRGAHELGGGLGAEPVEPPRLQGAPDMLGEARAVSRHLVLGRDPELGVPQLLDLQHVSVADGGLPEGFRGQVVVRVHEALEVIQ